MKLIVCLDDKDGMLFGTRRQSKDRLLRRDMLEMTAGSCLWMNAYSAAQFEEEAPQICVSESFLEEAEAGQWCFVENVPVDRVLDRAEQVVVYRWNRQYPATVHFPTDLFASRWKLAQNRDFPGHSHETITKEVYVL